MVLRIICLIATTIGIVCSFYNIGIFIIIIASVLNLVMLIKDTINKKYDSWYLMLIAFVYSLSKLSSIEAQIGSLLTLYCILVSIKNIIVLSKEITQKMAEKKK